MKVVLDREATRKSGRIPDHGRPRGLIERIMHSIRAVARFAYDLLKDLF